MFKKTLCIQHTINVNGLNLSIKRKNLEYNINDTKQISMMGKDMILIKAGTEILISYEKELKTIHVNSDKEGSSMMKTEQSTKVQIIMSLHASNDISFTS